MTTNTLTQQVVFDTAYSPDSEAFAQAFIDWGNGQNNAYLYLVFHDGAKVSRIIDEDWGREDFEHLWSWGQAWWSDFKAWPVGPELENGVEFVQRSLVPAETEAEPFEVAPEDLVFHTDTDIVGADFDIDAEDESDEDFLDEEIDGDDVVTNQVVQNGVTYVKNSVQFIGVGFGNVTPEDAHEVTSAANAFIEFMRERNPRLSPVLERYETLQAEGTV